MSFFDLLSGDERGHRYAMVPTVSVENVEEARSLLHLAREVLVSRAPGIVGAFRLEHLQGVGMSILDFPTKELAETAAAYPVPPMPGVKLLTFEIREVFARVDGRGRQFLQRGPSQDHFATTRPSARSFVECE
jgi:hypothetical protein